MPARVPSEVVSAILAAPLSESSAVVAKRLGVAESTVTRYRAPLRETPLESGRPELEAEAEYKPAGYVVELVYPDAHDRLMARIVELHGARSHDVDDWVAANLPGYVIDGRRRPSADFGTPRVRLEKRART